VSLKDRGKNNRKTERVGEDSSADAAIKKRLYNQVVISFWRPETKINKTICKFNLKFESQSLDAGGGGGGDFI